MIGPYIATGRSTQDYKPKSFSLRTSNNGYLTKQNNDTLYNYASNFRPEEDHVTVIEEMLLAGGSASLKYQKQLIFQHFICSHKFYRLSNKGVALSKAQLNSLPLLAHLHMKGSCFE